MSDRCMSRAVVRVAWGVALALLAGCGPAWEWVVDLDQEAPGKLDLDGDATYGDAIQDWSGDWWQWFVRIPGGDDHPVRGGDCTQGQDPDSDVWFLAGNYFEVEEEPRECTIPRGKYIFFPVRTDVSFSFWQPCAEWADCALATCEELEGYHDGWPEVDYPMTVYLDALDRDLTAALTQLDIERYRAQSPCIELIPPEGGERTDIYGNDCDFAQPWAEGNPCDMPVGSYKVAAAAGYFPLAEPPRPGEYTLHFTAENPDGGKLDITYDLTVE